MLSLLLAILGYSGLMFYILSVWLLVTTPIPRNRKIEIVVTVFGDQDRYPSGGGKQSRVKVTGMIERTQKSIKNQHPPSFPILFQEKPYEGLEN